MKALTDPPPQISRREFIHICAAAISAIGLQGCIRDGEDESRTLKLAHDQRIVMGSVANITILGPDEDAARKAIDACFGEMQDLEAVLSRFQPGSELTTLNRLGSLTRASPALIAVVRRALEFARLTQGAFDISVEPVLARYRESVLAGLAPGPEEIHSLLRLVDYRRVEIAEGSVRLGLSGMAITLDGIAKGFVIDQGVDVLRRSGFEQVLVEIGGDLVAGANPNRFWKVGIRSPRPSSNDLLDVALIVDRAMATSGDYVNTFSKDYTLHHIIDPRSGTSPSELASVSVLAASAMDADALSTSLMVLGPVDGLKLASGLSGVEALLVGKDLKEYATNGFPAAGNRSRAVLE